MARRFLLQLGISLINSLFPRQIQDLCIRRQCEYQVVTNLCLRENLHLFHPRVTFHVPCIPSNSYNDQFCTYVFYSAPKYPQRTFTALFSFLAVAIYLLLDNHTNSFNLIVTYLTSRPLSSHRQTHSMPSSPITTHISEPHNILSHAGPQISLNGHC